MKRLHILFISLFFGLIQCVQAQAAEFAGGTGQPGDPYQIATAEQLISIGADLELLGSHFVLIADIDLDPNLSEDYNFTACPIGHNFWGVFDGRGHHIKNLTITDHTTGDDRVECGLFQCIGWEGVVKRVVLKDVGITSSSVHGSIGPVCGSNDGLVLQCSATGVLSGGGSTGGLVGSNGGVVEQCYAACEIYARAAGGLIGYNSEIVYDCYAAGSVLGEYLAGGMVARQYLGDMRRCYSMCQVDSVRGGSGGLAPGGPGTDSGVFEDSYSLDPSEGGGADNGLGTPLTSEQMKDPDTFLGFRFWDADNGGLRGVWYAQPDGYPELVWQAVGPIFRVAGLPVAEACEVIEVDGAKVGGVIYDYDGDIQAGYVITVRPHCGLALGGGFDVVVSLGSYDWTENPGAGTAESPYLILSAGQFDTLASMPGLWGKHFELASDLDLAWRIYDRALIGPLDWGGVVDFDGAFDGNGHLIKNLTIEMGGEAGPGAQDLLAGLFAGIGDSGCLRDLGLEGVSIRGRGGYGHTGGMMCAINQGRIERSYCIGGVGANTLIGGLVGRNEGEIEDCYAQGDIWRIGKSSDYHAGLVALNKGGGKIRTSYAACVFRAFRGSGLVGLNANDSIIEQSLWDVEISGVDKSDGGTGLLTEELMSAEVLQGLGWGNSGNWTIGDGNDYPRLIWEGRSGELIRPSETGH